ncbi:MAG: hypothetical protein ABI432_03595 [Flavobacteriales bacterium]
MTNPSTLLFLFCTAAPGLVAQPIIDLPNMPMTGDVVTIGLCTDPIDVALLDASAGAMQTWDFSGLTESSEEQFLFVDPSSTPWASDFSNSNLCWISWDGSHSYYVLSPSALETEGYASIITGTPPEDTAKFLINVDTERLQELPYTYGDGFVDDFSGTFSAIGFVGTMNGTVDQQVDGYGTLILPTGTYTNVVRYHFDLLQNNTLFGSTTQSTKEHWGWFSADHRFWLLQMEINIDGLGSSEQVWYNKDPALAEPNGLPESEANSVSIFPNPVQPGSSAYITGMDLAHVRAQVIDATGRNLRMFPFGTTRIDTEGLAPGAYVVRFLNTTGTPLGAARLIVQ